MNPRDTLPTVEQIMSSTLRVVSAGDRLSHAAREMELGFLHHLPVVDEAGALVGILSQRDVLAAPDLDARVREVMTSEVLTVAPDTPACEAAYLLLRDKIGCLPVVAGGRLVGIITVSDFVRIAYSLLGGKVPVDQLELEEEEADRV